MLTDYEKRQEKIAKRMDKFDSVVTEYLRSSGYTTDELSIKLGINKSTLWRYRNRADSFAKAPFGVITQALHLANCSNETLRYICGI